MGFKRCVRKAAKFILSSSSDKNIKVEVAQINNGSTLSGKRIIVTGGGRGLGFAMAQKFVSEGAAVVISGRNESTLRQACKKLGVNASYIVSDVSDVDQHVHFLDECEKILDGIDCLVSNAGVSFHEGEFSKVSVDGFDTQFNINMRGAYFLSKAFLERKVSEENQGAQLLIISSETADQAYDIPYGMTKAAMNSFVRAASRRVYPLGIRVNAIAPGVTLSDMTKEYADVTDGNFYRDCASQRLFLPEEVAEVAAFLLSDASKCISGEIIHTNAGNHIKTWWDE